MPAAGTGISMGEAAHILDVAPTTVHRWIKDGILRRGKPHARAGLDRNEVEALAALRWTHHEGSTVAVDSYWVTTPAAAQILDVSRARVGQLVAKARLPYVQAACGVRLFGRSQVEVIANARISRRLQ